MVVFITWLGVCVIIGIVRYFKNLEQPPNNSEIDYMHEIHESERITLLDETIIKYTKLLDNLNEQYINTYDEKKKAAILSKQIVTMEKLNRLLEKREKLD